MNEDLKERKKRMRKYVGRWLCFLAALCLCWAVGMGEGETWVCPDCGQSENTGNFCPVCGTAKPSNQDTLVSARTDISPYLEQIPGETDRVKVLLSGVNASSYIVNKADPDKWLPANAVDGNETTCWQFSAKKGLKGKSWLEVFPSNAETVDEIWFKNGFWAYNDKGGDQYPINARLKKIRLEFMYQGGNAYQDAMEVTLLDQSRNGWQVFQVGKHEKVIAVRIAVISVYSGSHYKNDVCLSEIMLVRQASSQIALPPSEAQQAVVYESRPDVTGVGLLMKLATRSGPGTEYDEVGTFFPNTWQKETVRVLGKHYDGSVWWVLVDFSNSGKASYRVWTGLKRVDVDLNKLKEINGIGQGTVSATSETYRGPGVAYARAKVTINGWKDVVAYGHENGYVEVEFYQGGKWYRLWVPEGLAQIDWGTDFSGEI